MSTLAQILQLFSDFKCRRSTQQTSAIAKWIFFSHIMFEVFFYLMINATREKEGNRERNTTKKKKKKERETKKR